MNVYMTEDEQIELLKKWWNNYGDLLLSAILVLVVGITGYRWYNVHKQKVAMAASISFTKLQQQLALNDETAVEAEINTLTSNYPKTPYATAAQLLTAKRLVEKNKLNDALAVLGQVESEAKNELWRDLARMRMAQIYLAQKKSEQAIAQLDNISGNHFAPMKHMLRGDVFFATKKYVEAKEEYQTALGLAAGSLQLSGLIKMKLGQVTFRAGEK